MQQVTTISFFKVQGFQQQFWALSMMQKALPDLKRVSGQSFFKLLGSGRDLGFNPLPDWSTYALLQVWKSEAKAEAFLHQSDLMNTYRRRCSEVWTCFMTNTRSMGQWDGLSPFAQEEEKKTGPVAVLTRAKIKWHRLYAFWRYVPAAQLPLKQQPGLIYTKGVGEFPLTQMATISFWEDLEAMRAYAYQSPQHREAIRRSQQMNWFSEELFARFRVYRSDGSWNGQPMLAELEGVNA